MKKEMVGYLVGSGAALALVWGLLYYHTTSRPLPAPPKEISGTIPDKYKIKGLTPWHHRASQTTQGEAWGPGGVITQVPVAEVTIVADENPDGTITIRADASKSKQISGKTEVVWIINGEAQMDGYWVWKRTFPLDDYEITFLMADLSNPEYKTGASVIFQVNAKTAIM